MNNLKLFKQFWAKKDDFFVPIFWSKVSRILKSNFLAKKVSEGEFEENLRKIRQRPFNIHFEVTNACNSNCVFCAYRHMKRKKSFMPMKVYLKAMKDYEKMGGGNVHFCCVVGDPLLDPKLAERIKIAGNTNNVGEISVITNGINLKNIDLKEFLTGGLNRVYVSLAEFEEQVYKDVYGVNRYQDVFDGVLALLKLNKEMGKKVGITIGFRSYRPLNKIVKTEDFKKVAAYKPDFDFTWAYDNWVGRIKNKDLKGAMELRTPLPKKEPCFWFFDGPIVFENGDVGLCGCRDLEADSELIVGNVMSRSLADIWQDEKVERIRQSFYENNKIPKICQECTSYRNLDLFRTDEGTERAIQTEKRFLASKIYNQR